MTNPIYKIVATKFRKDWAKNDYLRDKDFSIPENVEVIRDISYGKNGIWNLLDVNLPKNNTNPLPVIVNFHGGGFFYGTKETYKIYAGDMASRGFAVINFNYRLSPENRFPKQLEDCNSVLTWICNNSEKYNLDLNRVFFVGDSAGANLVYFYSTILTNPDYAKLYDFEIPAIKPKAVALNCGLYKIADDINDLVSKAYVGSGKKKYAENLLVEKYVTSDFPPAYIVSAPNDFLLCQVQPMADFLKSKGVTVETKVYGTKEDPNAVHVFHLNMRLDYGKQCNDDECEFFNRLSGQAR